MDIFIKIAQLMLSLTILVFLHELGHFIPSKIFKVRVSKFYVFFDFLFPLPNILKFSLLKKKIGETEYGIGWFPFGGYVQIDGMVDESMDTAKLNEPPQPWEFRAKPTWQRLIIMIGGVTVNILLAMAIYSGILMAWGQQYLPMKNATNGIMVADSLANELGLQNGDFILSVNEKPVEDFNDFTKVILIEDAKTIEVKRNDRDTVLNVPEDFVSKVISERSRSKSLQFILPRFPVEVAQLVPGSNADKAGLLANDRIVGINDQSTIFFDELTANLQENKGQEVNLQVVRNGENKTLKVLVDDEGKIGFVPDMNLSKYYDITVVKYGIISAIPAGIKLAFSTLDSYIKQMKLLFNGKAKMSESLGGFGTIANAFDSHWNWLSFWNMTALISIILAVMNILPIPALDGGHVVFLLYEMIFRKAPPLKLMEYAQMVGMAILLFLMLYANGLDIFRYFFK
ncbi:MAG: RIP metalloprotease RseP [Chitinophagales bacterium]|nr:RIP metalloprotease RseP [Chitinophagales bacterium]